MAQDSTTVRVNEGTGSQTQEPQKTVSLSQNPKNNDGQSFMNIKERLEFLKVQGVHTPEERKEIEDLEKKLADGKEGNVTPEKGKKVGESEKEPKDIFKEDDIIHYMYNDWLIGGMNWLYKKTYKYIDRGYHYAKNRRDRLKEDLKNTKYNTIKTDSAIRKKRVKNYDTSAAAVDKGAEKTLADLEAIKSGNVDSTQVSALTKRIMNEIPESKRVAFCTAATSMVQNAAENIKTIQLLAGTLARTQMSENLCKDQEAFSNVSSEALLTALTKKNAILIARAANEAQERGEDIGKFFKDFDKKLKKADKFTDKQFKKNKFDEAGKKGKKNKHLQKLNELLGITQEDQAREQDLQPRSMLEHLVVSNNAEAVLTQTLDNNRRQLNASAAQRDINNNRRVQFQNRIAGFQASRHINPQTLNGATIIGLAQQQGAGR